MTDARNFLINSDYPVDHIAYLTSDSYVIPSGTIGNTIVISHGLGFTPLFDGQWSQTADFTVAYDLDTGVFPSTNISASPFSIAVTIDGLGAGSDSTSITLSTTNITNSDQTIYYRIYAFQPDDVHTDTNSTASSADNFVFNSDDNYMKLYSAGHISVSGAGTYTIPHNLGYIPQVRSWYTMFGLTRPTKGGNTHDFYVSADESNIYLVIGNFGSYTAMTRFDYRIYVDKAVV